MLYVQSNHLASIRAHAVRDYPRECCGLLVGTVAATGAILHEVWPMANVWDAAAAAELAVATDSEPRAASQGSNFSIAPLELLRAQKTARERQLSIIGVYHSHPDHPARPSEFDRAIAWPQYSYLIIAVPSGIAGEIRNWRLDDQQQFQPEPIVTDS
ncbi:MAG: M67 family metallopeptidase [Spirulinaceae cyanobacterium RM2_2_10]|nr:M67 family metallopeptidase [Spirulinaceae cyanobacterium SM2_1_0]NJO21249.1 M67 family metallopeptidase [Spirulinaceae cyanobacterium RM2_2_10]